MTETEADERLNREIASLDGARMLADPQIARRLHELTAILADETARARAEAEIRRATPRQRRRRVRWTVVGLLAILLGVFGGIPAAAAVERWIAHTGQFGPVTTESDRSEWIGLNASDTDKALASLYPSYLSFPTGVTKDGVIRWVITMNTASVNSDGAGSTHVIEQTTGIRESYEFVGVCAWDREWLAADAANDLPRITAASAGVTAAAHWPATASASPEMTRRNGHWAKLMAEGNRAAGLEDFKEMDCADLLEGLGQ
jgi:hypothetical protein